MEIQNLRNNDAAVDHSPTIRDFVAIVFRHKKVMALSFVGILLGATLVALLQPNRYQAQMKILVKRERIDPVVTPQASAISPVAVPVTEEDLNSEVELLKSQDLLEKVVLACGLERRSNPASAKSKPTSEALEQGVAIEKAVRVLEKQLKVDVVNKTNLIAVEYESADSRLAAQVLSTLGSLYLEKHVVVHRPPGTLDFFEQETERYRKGLADGEAHLADFTNDGTVSARLEKEAALQKLAEFEATEWQTQQAIGETRRRIKTLETQASSTPTRIVTQVRNSDDGILLSGLRSNLLNLELKRTELLEKFEPGYRLVREVDDQIAQTRSALTAAEKSTLRDETTDQDPTYEWVRAELAKARADLAGLQAKAEVASRTVRAYRENARILAQKEIVQEDLFRTVKVGADNYMLYLQKKEEARISEALDRRRIINVAIAEAPTAPSLPSNRRYFTVLLGFLLATLMSVGTAFVAEYADSTFRTPDEVRLYLNIPVLASMSSIAKNGKHGSLSSVPQSRSSAGAQQAPV
jgi:uncharacterized protein involved in exopolysaccharide biosynthesis